MKYEATKKAILSNYSNVIKVGYCHLQTLLKFHSPTAYTASKTYGWQADVYEITPDTVIVTGYAPFGNIVPDYELIKEYENEAEILDDVFHQTADRLPTEILARTPKLAHLMKVPPFAYEIMTDEKACLNHLLRCFVREITPN